MTISMKSLLLPNSRPTSKDIGKQMVNCWNTLRATQATTQRATAIVTAENCVDWAISSQAPQGEGSTTIPQGSRAERLEAPSTPRGEDIVWTIMKVMGDRFSQRGSMFFMVPRSITMSLDADWADKYFQRIMSCLSNKEMRHGIQDMQDVQEGVVG